MLNIKSHSLPFFILFLTFITPAEAQPQVTVTQSKTPSGATITNYETTGNLASKHSLGCMPLSGVKNEYSPADIYPAVADCLKTERYQEATNLFNIAGAYAYFDKLRVTDRTAHQGAQVLIMNNLAGVDPLIKEKWKTYMDGQSKTDTETIASTCDAIRHLGPPNYYPAYMIQHGMQAFMNNSNNKPLVELFNPQEAWNSALDKYLHCPIDQSAD